MHALPLILGVLAAMAIAYRFYSRFLARRVMGLDDSRPTPAHVYHDGQNYHATNRGVLFGHHFAAISGAGPLIGPVLAIQFGYMPGLLWLVIGVCLAGAVQDMLVLAASVRNDGKSLAEMARRLLGGVPGNVAAISILFIVIIALSGLGMVVVKALGGEQIKLVEGTRLSSPTAMELVKSETGTSILVPPQTTTTYPTGTSATRSEKFAIEVPGEFSPASMTDIEIPAGAFQRVPGSSWGSFTIFCTIPIALFVGWYMYRLRPGRIVEASLIGAAAVLAATVAGNWIPGSSLESTFSLSRTSTIVAICLYGFVASVLPVWLLLCPRDYLSSFLKIGTIALLVGGIMIANPTMSAPPVNQHFAGGGGPLFSGAIFPFVFICIMCGAISGFHALVSSGTTPKMVNKESDVRMIGYGSMLLEGLVGVVALLSAAALPQEDYWAINIKIEDIGKYADKLTQMGAGVDHLSVIEEQVGGESLRGRTGGAVTLAVGMAQIMTKATERIAPGVSIDSVIKYWYHFAIMFEALFILTTIDTGTRIARFLLQEILGKFFKSFERVDWTPGVIISTGLVTLGWGGLIWTGSIDTIWPMFGIANQLLAAIALVIVTTYMVANGKARYTWATLLPLAFVTTTTITAASQLVTGKFWMILSTGLENKNWNMVIQGGLNIAASVFLVISFLIILVYAITQWIELNRSARSVTTPVAPQSA
ncbi:MAG: carbon starvation CstA family protein [Aureliella sp.]